MSHTQPTIVPPSDEFEREIRELYHERNTKTFATPNKTAHPHGFASQLIVVFVSVIASAAVAVLAVTIVLPQVFPQPSERFVRRVAPIVIQTMLREDVSRRLAQAVVAIYPAHTGSSSTAQAYVVAEALGQGLVLSSDGWLVTTRAVVSDIKRSLAVVTADGESHEVIKVVADTATPFIFMKVSGANLTATAFAQADKLSVGQSVFPLARSVQSVTPEWYPRLLSTPLLPLVTTRAELVQSSEIVPDRFLLDQALPKAALGAPVATEQGEIIGLVDTYRGELRAIVPLQTLEGIIDQLFSAAEVHRPVLGIMYTQADWVTPFTPGVGEFKGALVNSVARTVPSGLKVGDYIVEMAGEKLLVQSLAARLLQFRAGSKLELTVRRGGSELKIPFVLADSASLAPAKARE